MQRMEDEKFVEKMLVDSTQIKATKNLKSKLSVFTKGNLRVHDYQICLCSLFQVHFAST